MASLAFGLAGAGIGFLIGGPLGAAIGWAIGSTAGGILFPQKSEGPRLSDLKLQTSNYGQMIPICYGTIRIAGNVIWQTDLKEHSHSSGGKGGGSSITTYSYSASFAVALCEGPIANVTRIWADSRLVYDNRPGTTFTGTFPFALYLGDEVQTADPTMQAELGAANVPANRGVAYVVFNDIDLTDYFNRIPSLTFEVVTEGTPNAAIRALIVDNSEPFQFRTSQHNIISGTATAYPQPAFTAVPNDGSDIRIKAISYANLSIIVTGSTVQTYNSTTLAWTGSGAPGSQDGFPQAVNTGVGTDGHDPNFYPSCEFAGLPLWYNWHNATGSSLDFPALPYGDIQGMPYSIDPNRTPYTSNNLASLLPAGVYIMGLAVSGDGKTLMVMTGPYPAGHTSPISYMDAWYQISNGAVIASGTISPTLDIGTLAYGPAGNSWSAISTSNALENNLQYLWFCDGVTLGGQLTVYAIDGAGNLALNLTCGNLNFGDSDSGIYVTSISYKDGCVALAGGKSLGLFTRFPPGVSQYPTLADVVSALSVRAGLTTGDIDVTGLEQDTVYGYVIPQQSDVRGNIQPLQSAYFFDGTESDTVMKFVKRGANPLLTIPQNDLAAMPMGGTPPPLTETVRRQDVDLPKVVNMQYFNIDADYQNGTQIAQRVATNTQMETNINLAMVFTDTQAANIVWRLLQTTWVERETFTFFLSRQYAYLEPTDVVIANGYAVRIMAKDEAGTTTIKFEGVLSYAPAFLQAQSAASAPSTGTTPTTPPKKATTNLVMLDLPLIHDTDQPNGYYVAMAGVGSGAWPGAALFESSDGGSSYPSQIATDLVPDVIGASTNVLADFSGGNVFDEVNSVNVTIATPKGTLSSLDELSVLNGGNLAVLGNEVFQYKNATLQMDGSYTLTGLLRGRRGSNWATATHTVGETFVVLPTSTNVAGPFGELGQSRLFKAVTFGSTLAASIAYPFTNNGAALRPYAPCLVGGALCTPFDGSVLIDWTRRTRKDGAWNDFVDVPVSEATEQYVLQVWNQTYTQCARVVTGLTSPTFTYTHAMQVTDFGANQAQIFISVGQVGAYLLGTQTKATITGSGGSNGNPITPVPPYNSAPPPPTGGCTLPVQSASFTWGTAPSQVTNAAADGVHTWVVSFTTGANVAGIGQINVGALTGGAQIIDAVLSTSPCGAPLTPLAQQVGTSPLILFYMTDNPFPTEFPTLLASTTYYLSCNFAGLMSAQATLTIPTAGGSSGPGGGAACVGFNVENVTVPWLVGGPTITLPSFGANDAIVIKFTTGAAVPAHLGFITIAEDMGPTEIRTAVLATQPCVSTSDVDATYGKVVVTNPYFAIGCGYTGSPVLGTLYLTPNTIYYITLTNRNSVPANTCTIASCGMAIQLSPPH